MKTTAFQTAALLFTIACTPPVASVDEPDDSTPSPTDTVDTDPTADTTDDTPVVSGMPFHETGVQLDGMLYSGAWRDLDHWEEFGELVRFNSDWYQTHAAWGFAPTQRFRVLVRDGIGPTPDARVLLYRQTELVFEGRANAQGIAEVYGGLFDLSGGPWSLTAIHDNRVLQKLNVSPSWQSPWTMELTDDVLARPDAVDLAIAVDTRAEYAQEFAWLQEHIAQLYVDGTREEAPTRYASVLFDNLDVTRVPLDADPTAATLHVTQGTANGGQEVRLVEALESLADLEWQESAAHRIAIVLVGRLRASQLDLERLHAAVLELSRLGVRIHPVSLDPEAQTTFLLRDLAITTNGTWNFVLQPGPPAPTELVGAYTLQDLHDLITSQLLGAATP